MSGSLDENKALVRRWIEDVLYKKNIAAFDDYLALGGETQDNFKSFLTYLCTAFPDIHGTFDTQIAEGDLVATTTTSYGTHLGEFLGIPPTGKHVSWQGLSFDRISGDKIVEHWSQPAFLDVVEQLGARITPAEDPS